MFERSLIEAHLPTVQAGQFVAHYTRIGTLKNFFHSTGSAWVSAWASPVQFLNDRRELTLGLDVLNKVANEAPQSRRLVRAIIEYLLATPGSVSTDGFQMSFSTNRDELGQWRAYAANGFGCSVVTTASDVHTVASVAGPVIYDPRDQHAFASKVKLGLRGINDRTLLEKYLIAAACFMKQEGFAPESEYRMLKFPAPADVEFRESGDRLVPYTDFLQGTAGLPIHRIVVGPSWQLRSFSDEQRPLHHVLQGVARLLEVRNILADIEISSIPFDPR